MEFQLTAARRRLVANLNYRCFCRFVSTHSRPKAAGRHTSIPFFWKEVSTHSRPKAAGTPSSIAPTNSAFQLTAARRRLATKQINVARQSKFQLTAARRRLAPPESRRRQHRRVSTHSRPKAAGWLGGQPMPAGSSFNSQPPESGWVAMFGRHANDAEFQLTAARRRLVMSIRSENGVEQVSTHSRPKAAG